MKLIMILEPDDKVRATDWIRSKDIHGSEMGDIGYVPFALYSGKPYDICQWVRVSDVLGECWVGKTVSHICRKLRKYEFVRGELPPSAIWNWKKDYAKLNGRSNS